jgi:hypothetical protein
MNDHGHQDRKWFAGLDLGQSQDHTAVVLVERMTTWQQDRDAATLDRVADTTYNVRHLERTKLGTPYQAVVERVRGIVEMPQLDGRITLVVDATGVGGPVVDLLRVAVKKAPIVPVVITGGDRPAYQDGRYRIPKRDLIAGLTVTLETGRLKISQRLPEAKTLTKELSNMRVKISSSGHDAYEAWRSGDHDDMVLALALALWRAKLAARRQMAVPRPLLH